MTTPEETLRKIVEYLTPYAAQEQFYDWEVDELFDCHGGNYDDAYSGGCDDGCRSTAIAVLRIIEDKQDG